MSLAIGFKSLAARFLRGGEATSETAHEDLKTVIPSDSRRDCCGIVGVRFDRESDDEFVEPDDWSLPLPRLLVVDDAELGKSAKLVVNVLDVPVDDARSLLFAVAFYNLWVLVNLLLGPQHTTETTQTIPTAIFREFLGVVPYG